MVYKQLDGYEDINDILLLAREGDEDALLVLLARCEPLINKFARKPDGSLDPDLRQHLLVEWLIAVKAFDPSRYSCEKSDETR